MMLSGMPSCHLTAGTHDVTRVFFFFFTKIKIDKFQHNKSNMFVIFLTNTDGVLKKSLSVWHLLKPKLQSDYINNKNTMNI